MVGSEVAERVADGTEHDHAPDRLPQDDQAEADKKEKSGLDEGLNLAGIKVLPQDRDFIEFGVNVSSRKAKPPKLKDSWQALDLVAALDTDVNKSCQGRIPGQIEKDEGQKFRIDPSQRARNSDRKKRDPEEDESKSHCSREREVALSEILSYKNFQQQAWSRTDGIEKAINQFLDSVFAPEKHAVIQVLFHGKISFEVVMDGMKF